MDGTAMLLNADNPDGFSGDSEWYLFAAKTTFSF
jgi:hypothetical protein